MRVRLEPINPTVGDLEGNSALIIDRITQAADAGVDLIVFPECAITGYPPRDMLREPGFVDSVSMAAVEIARVTEQSKATAVVGCPWGDPNHVSAGGLLSNSALVLAQGEIIARYDKQLLPTYDVFDEARYFEPGSHPLVIQIGTHRVGILICEDLWRGADVHTGARYLSSSDPVAQACADGADTLCVLSASPFIHGKAHRQSELLLARAEAAGVSLLAVNQSGANDDLVFDGHAAAIACTSGGHVTLRAVSEPFQSTSITADLDCTTQDCSTPAADPFAEQSELDLLWQALVCGIRDYAAKCGFQSACLGLSGGIDSALTAVLATAALGSENVFGVLMPSKYSSKHSIDDAIQLAENLGISHSTAPIEHGHDALGAVVSGALSTAGARAVSGITDENIQSRLRGLIMMGISNATGSLLLTTGNKSEHAVGYATLYGDMNGGLAPLADVLKSTVYELSDWVNASPQRAGFTSLQPASEGAVIPENTIRKPPSAELRPDQTDQDTLPDYSVLDRIIELYVEGRRTRDDITQLTTFDPELVDSICSMIDRAEFKRFQLCVALKVTPIAFGPGRRMPIACKRTHAGYLH